MDPKSILSGEIDPRQAAQFMRKPSRLASLLQEEAPGWDASPAEILADIINVQRADTKRMADLVGVDVEIQMMSEERAAELISGIMDGDGVELIQVFNDLGKQRDKILRKLLSEGDYREFMRNKTSVMYTDDPETWDENDYGDQSVEPEEYEELDEPEGATDGDVAEAVADGGEIVEDEDVQEDVDEEEDDG